MFYNWSPANPPSQPSGTYSSCDACPSWQRGGGQSYSWWCRAVSSLLLTKKYKWIDFIREVWIWILKIIRHQGLWWSTSCHRFSCAWSLASWIFLFSTCVSLRAFPSYSGLSITCGGARFGPCCCANGRLALFLFLLTVGRAAIFRSSCNRSRLGRYAFLRNLRPVWQPSERDQ